MKKNPKSKRAEILIGIDPGKKTGVAVTIYGKLEYLYTIDFWMCYDFITTGYRTDQTEIHIEDTSDLPIFHKGMNKRSMGEIGRRVGSVCREAELLNIGFSRLGYTVIMHRNKKTSKIDSETFKRLTGWKGRSNQHERDAVCLII